MTIGFQNSINAQTPAKPRRRRTQPQADGCEAYEVTIPAPLASEVQRYLGENKGVDFNDVIAWALEAFLND